MRAQHGLLRGRRGLGAAVAAALAALALVLVPAGLSVAGAAFSGTTVDTGDQLATSRLQPPSGLTATQSCTAAPTITERTATSATGTGSVTLAMPSGTSAGDVLVAHVAYHDGGVTLSAPSTWARLGQTTDSGTHVTSAVYWKVAAAGEPTAVFSHPTDTAAVMAAGLTAFVGASGATAPAIAGASGSSATATTPSLTTTATNVAVLHLFSKTHEALPAPAGTTSLFGVVNGSGTGSVGVRGAVETFAGPGSTPARSATSPTADSSAWVTQAVVLQRVRDTPSAALSWTPTSSSWASGYVLAREVGGAAPVTSTVSGASTASATQSPLVNDTAYVFRLTTSKGTWRSTSVTASLTPSC
jgi:hypothetical protein